VQSREIRGVITARPTLAGAEPALAPTDARFAIPAGADHTRVRFALGQLPSDIVGRLALEVAFSSSSRDYRFIRPSPTPRVKVFCIYDHPLDPSRPSPVQNQQDTISGTRQRMDHLMRLLDGSTFRHSVAGGAADVNRMIWKLHVGINHATPPYFDGGHDEHITCDGEGGSDNAAARKYHVKDQWLMWVRPQGENPALTAEQRRDPAHERDLRWNDASCAGHVQLLKTMTAAMGVFTRAVWVLPMTTRMPPVGRSRGSYQPAYSWRGGELQPSQVLASIADQHIYSTDIEDDTHRQWWRFDHPDFPGNPNERIWAFPVLIEPNGAWENFEACALTADGRFLPGGYHLDAQGALRTEVTPQGAAVADSYRTNQGFTSARDVLRWWSQTIRPNFGRRFLLWVGEETRDIALAGTPPIMRKFTYYFDVNGRSVPLRDVTRVRDAGLDLPVP
jgi:hypothetical protein